ncbi:aspartate aminotransferase family protein [Radicibacter daui]|uniref:aspartate aminotransferase family protein n=1 Tax=Radicibacter daui TaxID=3064829 RepID=UPI004046F11D
MDSTRAPNDLEAFWMPFTMNRAFKKAPRMVVKAEGMYYWTPDGRKIIDGLAGLWCVNAGHGRKKIVEAVQAQVAEMDFAPTFQFGHPLPFEFANRLTEITPEGFGHVFFTNSGSESVDTALKIALAYHRARGEGTRRVIIGRERGYHGVGFGGISIGGLPANRKAFGQLLPAVDHISATYSLEHQAHTTGEPEWGAHLADELEKVIALHDASNVAAVIVEPVAGSAGVLLPPKGYLKRLREICDKHGVLLIFDEVITGFGRIGAPFASQRFDVLPDLITTAKGITNGTVPCGAVLVQDKVHNAFMTGPEYAMEFYHGYTYSGHPLACAAGIATLDVYKEEGLLTRAAKMEAKWAEMIHSFKGLPNVIDTRAIGLIGAVELAPRKDAPGRRALDVHTKCYETGALVRMTGDIIALSPPLIIDENQMDELHGVLSAAIKAVD